MRGMVCTITSSASMLMVRVSLQSGRIAFQEGKTWYNRVCRENRILRNSPEPGDGPMALGFVYHQIKQLKHVFYPLPDDEAELALDDSLLLIAIQRPPQGLGFPKQSSITRTG